MHHAGGATTLRVNQEQNGGEWVPLGSFDMAPGQNHRVVLSDDANEYVIGDAVRFVLETNKRAVVADAVKIVGESPPPVDFAATGATVLREYVTLDGQPLALVEGSEIRYVHPDHLGIPQKMTDTTGALVWDAVYKPFGEAHAITGTATNPQRFPGQLYDPETGFHYNYFRDYAPGLGRYLESDPIGLDGGLNTYAYVGGNPMNYVDPDGLQAVPVPIGPLPIPIPPEAIPGTPENDRLVESTIDALNALGDLLDGLGDDDECERLAQADEEVCRNLCDPDVRARCWASANERYGACVAGRPLPPLVTW